MNTNTYEVTVTPCSNKPAFIVEVEIQGTDDLLIDAALAASGVEYSRRAADLHAEGDVYSADEIPSEDELALVVEHMCTLFPGFGERVHEIANS